MRKISEEEYKNIILNVLLSVDRICGENHLRYMIFFGTLLGAVRHGGFIPWDDDIDIIMPREDYDRLCGIIGKGYRGLRCICVENTPDTLYPYAKICDASTSLKELNFVDIEGYGAYIDVFPVDRVPSDPEQRSRLNRRLYNQIRILMHSTRTGYEKSGSFKTDFLRFAALCLGKLVDRRKMVRRLNSEFRRMNEKETGVVSVPWDPSNFAMRTEEFDNCVPILFEGHSVRGPRDPDALLRQLYGEYWKLPPEEARVSNHSFECFALD